MARTRCEMELLKQNQRASFFTAMEVRVRNLGAPCLSTIRRYEPSKKIGGLGKNKKFLTFNQLSVIGRLANWPSYKLAAALAE